MAVKCKVFRSSSSWSTDDLEQQIENYFAENGIDLVSAKVIQSASDEGEVFVTVLHQTTSKDYNTVINECPFCYGTMAVSYHNSGGLLFSCSCGHKDIKSV